MKRLFLFLAVFCFFSLVAAQTAEPTVLDPVVVQKILDGAVLSIGFTFLVQLIKTKLGIKGPLVFVGSFIVSVLLTALYFLTIAPPLTLEKEIGYAVVAWAVGNGWYKFKTA